MVRKGTTSVYVDREKVERIKNMGLDLSNITTKALDIIDSDEFADIAVEMRLKINDDVINTTREEILRLETRLTYLRQRLENSIAKRTDILNEYEVTKKTVMLSRYMYQLNLAIIAAQYDLITVRESAKEVVEKIVTINPMFQLDVHITNFRKEMNR
jgi:hypothetical protein